MGGSFATQIEMIINQRKSRLGGVQAAIERLVLSRQAVDRLTSVQESLRHDGDSKFKSLPVDIQTKILSIPTEAYYKEATLCGVLLDRLAVRFARDTLNVSFVGRAGQGKSLVLQKISGLDGRVIPSSQGADCTGAKSIIANSNVEHAVAELTFYSESEIVGIVNKYITTIYGTSVAPVTNSEDIRKLVLPALDPLSVSAQAIAMREHLRKYVDHIADLRKNMGKTISVDETRIEKYVAQYSSEDDSIRYYNYLGVKSAKIKCRFPAAEVGKLELVDTMGIGATSLGVEEEMLQTVREDSDAIVFMFRPDELRINISDEEISIIDKIVSAVGSNYTKEMLFWVVNKLGNGGTGYQRAVFDLLDKARASDFPVADVLGLDCSSESEVRYKLLSPLLQGMTTKLGVVDQMLIAQANTESELVQKEYIQITEALGDIFVGGATDDLKRALRGNIVSSKNQMQNGLRELCAKDGKYDILRRKSCLELEQAVDEALRQVYATIPSVDEIIDIYNNSEHQHRTCEKCFAKLRVEIINSFLRINTVLAHLVLGMKDEVVNVLAGRGKLGAIVAYKNVSPDAWLREIVRRINKQGQRELLTVALDTFAHFRFTVQDFMIYDVRDCLDEVDYTLMTKLPDIKAPNSRPDLIAAEIREYLCDRMSDIQSKIKENVASLYDKPHLVLFAAIKDLYDGLFEANACDCIHNSDFELTDLYEDFMVIIWSDRCKEITSYQVVQKEYKTLVDDLGKYNRLDYLKIV